MANLSEHIAQAKRNLQFLTTINETANSFWDWQVTTCFYTAVHLINGYLADKANLHYESHIDTLSVINPEKKANVYAVTQACYLAYRKLFNDSIRSRYLNVSREEKTPDYNPEIAYLTHDRHFMKNLKRLSVVMDYVDTNYSTGFPTYELDCIELRNKTVKYFSYKQKVVVPTTEEVAS